LFMSLELIAEAVDYRPGSIATFTLVHGFEKLFEIEKDPGHLFTCIGQQWLHGIGIARECGIINRFRFLDLLLLIICYCAWWRLSLSNTGRLRRAGRECQISKYADQTYRYKRKYYQHADNQACAPLVTDLSPR